MKCQILFSGVGGGEGLEERRGGGGRSGEGEY